MSKLGLKNFIIPAIALLGLTTSAAFWLAGRHQAYSGILTAVMVVGTAPVLWRMLQNLRRGHFGVDLIAIVAIGGSFVLRQFLAGTVILLMLSGGEALEAYALQRARRELTALLSRVPTVAHKKFGREISDINVAVIQSGDILVVKPGEVVPADGLVIGGVSELDESAITGESVPAEKRPGSPLYSGSVNRSGVLEFRTSKPASESTYEKIIRLVRQASESRAPVVRLADRYSVWFTGVTFAIAAAAWQLFHDPVRLLAVLVVATPCPLILATPIAIMSGVSRAAGRGIIVKSGGALEKLAGVKAFIFDKTGTLTLGAPEVTSVRSVTPVITGGLPAGASAEAEAGDDKKNSADEIVRISASLDQLSAHVLAISLTRHAVNNLNLRLDYPQNFHESFGDGVTGEIKNQKFSFGKLAFIQKLGVAIPAQALAGHEQAQNQGKISVYLAQGSRLLGFVQFADVVRPEIKNLFADIYRQGIKHVVMLTGDKKIVAEQIGKQIGLNDIHAEALPEGKVLEVRDHKRQFGAVAMVGDGVNDAPALAAADVGIAIGGHGSTASSESGDIVITVDDLSRVGQALKIAKATLSIAKQSVFIGMGVSVLLMVIAALGHIMPVYGALIQEGLDVAVILNALRVNFIKI